MKCFIIDTLIAIFAIDETGTILNFINFNDEDQKIITFYQSLDKGFVLKDFETFILDLKNSGFNYFIFDNRKLESFTSKELKLETSLNTNAPEFRTFRFNLSQNLKKIGINISDVDLLSRVKTLEEELVRRQVSIIGAQNDIIVIRTIDSIDTIKKSISLYSSRLREWYGLHFPELTDKLIEDNIIIAKLIYILGDRKNFTVEKIQSNFEFKERRIELLEKLASKSMGATIEVEVVQNFAEQILKLDQFRSKLEEYLENLMIQTAPNLNAIVGSLIGAKLIAKAGSLKRLAYMPASRIQILGAEKALYRFLKTGEKRPKHGLIYQWNLIRGSKAWNRGKIARLIAGKIGIAAKVDYFKGDFVADLLSTEIKEKINEIERKYPKKPKNQVIKTKRKVR